MEAPACTEKPPEQPLRVKVVGLFKSAGFQIAKSTAEVNPAGRTDAGGRAALLTARLVPEGAPERGGAGRREEEGAGQGRGSAGIVPRPTVGMDPTCACKQGPRECCRGCSLREGRPSRGALVPARDQNAAVGKGHASIYIATVISKMFYLALISTLTYHFEQLRDFKFFIFL